MLTYTIRKRVFRLSEGDTLVFPNHVEVRVVLQPLQPFGAAPDGGRTAVRGVPATVRFDANSGRHTIESKVPPKPLEVVIEDPVRRVELRGNELFIRTRCETLEDVNNLIEAIYYGFPMLLNVDFADPPIVERVNGKVGDTPFGWELKSWRGHFDITTQELQEKRVVSAWKRFEIISQPINRRVIAALHYFHVACRLSGVGQSPGEFMAEAILNFSKMLEVLFPATGDEKALDAAREGLKELDFSEDEIEGNFIPAMVLRNHIDVAHVFLSIFTSKQLQVLHQYTESAESSFRSLLQRLLERIQTGLYEVRPYPDPAVRPDAAAVIEKLAHHLGEPDYA